MKKIIWILVLAGFSPLVLVAQYTNRGNFMIGSSVGFSSVKSKVKTDGRDNDGLSALQLNIAPNLGYFILDQVVLGVSAEYNTSSVTEPSEDKTTDSDLLFGPFARTYFPVSDNSSFFLMASFGFGSSSDNQIVNDVKQNYRTNISSIGVGPGLTIISRSGLGLEAILKYNYAQSKFDTEIGGVKTSNTTRTNNFSLSLGVQYYFGGFRSAGY